jgi:diguanylate cyclase (GGDEF)-like protein
MPATATPRPVPLRALILSLAALAIPALGVFAAPAVVQGDQGMLIWLTALIPAFLLAYYRGLRGVATAAAAGMAVLSLTQAFVLALGLHAPDWRLLFGIVTVYVSICIALAVVAELLHRERRIAESLALRDVLTGLPNRRHADVLLDAQFAAARRGHRLAVVLFDLDRFKQLNDRHGHAAGDAALQAFADVLRRNTRRMNLSARVGGEEFLSVLPDVELAGAVRFAERVVAETRALRLASGPLTASAGLAAFEQGMGSHEVLVAAADRALYAAKREGRDRVVVAQQFAAGGSAGSAGAGAARVSASSAILDLGGSETVLVIDDDEDVRNALVRMLRAAGYRVEATDDPDEVLARYGQGRGPDLLVTDIVMPKMSGLTLADRVLAQAPGLRVVYLSGYLQHEVSWRGLPGAVAAFVGKPVDLRELLRAVRDVLERPYATPDSSSDSSPAGKSNAGSSSVNTLPPPVRGS